MTAAREMDRMPALSLDHMPALSLEPMPALSLGPMPALSLDHVPALSMDHMPVLSLEHMPALSSDRMPTLSLERMPVQSLHQRPSRMHVQSEGMNDCPNTLAAATVASVTVREFFEAPGMGEEDLDWEKLDRLERGGEVRCFQTTVPIMAPPLHRTDF